MATTSKSDTPDHDGPPRHIGIIMDGNGRWARKHGLPRVAGHEAGAKSVRTIVETARKEDVGVLSLYAFSTENWRRSKTEVSALFRLLSKYIRMEIQNLHEEGIRVIMTGRIAGLSKRIREDIDQIETLTASNTKMTLNVAINYGGRSEIADAAQAIARDVQAGNLDPDKIDEACFGGYLYRPELPDMDLLIRTSGELRISNFMLWQVSYAEIVCTKTLWPDFRKRHFLSAIEEYRSRSRRYGGR
jgi:undecaprenyl diphosphate synthase